MIIKTLVVGPFQCNCTIIACEKTKEAIVVDPGDEFDRIQQAAQELGVNLKYAVHTHAHLDHIGAIGELKRAHPAMSIALHKKDEVIYNNLPLQGQLFGFQYAPPPKVDKFIEHTESLQVGEHVCEVIHTPGHSPGGICLKFKEGILAPTPFLFSGDTLFHESIGRTDLWEGDHGQLVKSIKQELFVLPEETTVLPGHGPRTSIAHEKRNNPFL